MQFGIKLKVTPCDVPRYIRKVNYLTRAVISPTSDPGKEVLLCPVSLSCPSCPRFFKHLVQDIILTSKVFVSLSPIISSFLAEELRPVCQTQYAHKDTESDSCRLQVCSFCAAEQPKFWQGKVAR